MCACVCPPSLLPVGSVVVYQVLTFQLLTLAADVFEVS